MDPAKVHFFNLFDKPLKDTARRINLLLVFTDHTSPNEIERIKSLFQNTSRNFGVGLEIIENRVDGRDGTRCLADIEHALTELGEQGVGLVVLPNSMKTQYKKIKQHCLRDRSILSQVMLASTLKHKNVQSILTKVLLQINAKLGNVLWAARLPRQVSKTMLMGISVNKDGANPSQAAVGVCCSVNEAISRYFSILAYQAHASVVVTNLLELTLKQMEAYYRANQNTLPEEVIVLREGVAEGQIPQVYKFECEALKAAFAKIGSYSPRLTIIALDKKPAIKFMTEGEGNPPPGTWVNEKVVSAGYDFYMVPQNVRNGTAVPTYYKAACSPGHPPRVQAGRERHGRALLRAVLQLRELVGLGARARSAAVRPQAEHLLEPVPEPPRPGQDPRFPVLHMISEMTMHTLAVVERAAVPPALPLLLGLVGGAALLGLLLGGVVLGPAPARGRVQDGPVLEDDLLLPGPGYYPPGPVHAVVPEVPLVDPPVLPGVHPVATLLVELVAPLVLDPAALALVPDSSARAQPLLELAVVGAAILPVVLAQPLREPIEVLALVGVAVGEGLVAGPVLEPVAELAPVGLAVGLDQLALPEGVAAQPGPLVVLLAGPRRVRSGVPLRRQQVEPIVRAVPVLHVLVELPHVQVAVRVDLGPQPLALVALAPPLVDVPVLVHRDAQPVLRPALDLPEVNSVLGAHQFCPL